jgi:hypothetical protein
MCFSPQEILLLARDHSGKYYAAYFEWHLHDNSIVPEEVRIWDITTGKMIRHIPSLFFPESPGARLEDVMVVAKRDPNEPQQVVIAGSNAWSSDGSGPNRGRLGRWSSSTELRAFPIEDGPSGWGGYVRQDGMCYTSIFKVPRSPNGITSVDDPTAPEYMDRSEEIGGLRLMFNHLCLRGFYPSATPGVMDLEWQTYLKSPNDNGQAWELCSGSSVYSNSGTNNDICGDEFASAFLEL